MTPHKTGIKDLARKGFSLGFEYWKEFHGCSQCALAALNRSSGREGRSSLPGRKRTRWRDGVERARDEGRLYCEWDAEDAESVRRVIAERAPDFPVEGIYQPKMTVEPEDFR